MDKCKIFFSSYVVWCWEAVGWGARPSMPARLGASSGADPELGAKPQTLLSYSGACARPVGGSSQACPALSTSVCQKTAKIVGFNQGKKWGGGLGPLLQLQWKCYKVSQETEDHLTQLSWNQNTFFSEGNLLSFLLPLPFPPFPYAHLIFWEEISSLLCRRKETVCSALTWPWHCLY